VIALYRKELRSLLPMLALSVFLVSGDMIARPMTERLDEDTFSDVAGIAAGEGTFLGFILGILAFMMAYASLPREHDEGTIEFLYALPVTRRGIFVAKALAGLTMLWITCALGQVTNAIIVCWNPTSFDGEQLNFRLAATAALLHALVATVMYAHGLFASFFRRFGLLPYAMLAYVIIVVTEIMPELAWLDPLRLARCDYFGARLLVPVSDALFHLGIAGLVSFIAYVLWMGSLDRLRNFFAMRTAAFTVGFGCLTAAVGLVGFFVMGFWAVREFDSLNEQAQHDPRVAREAEGVTFQTSEARTAHYAFVYPDNLHDRAMDLATRSDRVIEDVTHRVGERDVPFVTVDLAEVSAHHEGITAGARIRMGLVDQAPWRLVHVLAHETTHVLQGVASHERLMEYGDATRFFVEGGAEWVAFESCLDPASVMRDDERAQERELREASRVVAVTSWERHAIRFDDLVDNAHFTARWDTALAYPLGETFSEAIARACGPTAYGEVIRSFARTEVPQSATHDILFRDALSSFGCDYERVGAAWDGLMHDLAASERAHIDAIPRMAGGVIDTDEHRVLIEMTLDRAPLAVEHYTVRVRADAQTPDTEVRATVGTIVEGSEPRRVRFEVPRNGVRGLRFELIFSLDVDPRAFPYSEAWQGAAL
jgi:hypothetical protein